MNRIAYRAWKAPHPNKHGFAEKRTRNLASAHPRPVNAYGQLHRLCSGRVGGARCRLPTAYLSTSPRPARFPSI